MNFEWKKLINGESDIDADDINALADGIIENEKEIKAIKDIMDNGGTIPEYLTEFFKEIPEGMTIDDLDGRHIGCYLIEETQNVYGLPCAVKYLLFVNSGLFVNSEEQRDEGHIFQTRYYYNALNGITKIQRRMSMYNEPGLWEDWQDEFATLEYVNEQIAQIPTGGGGETWELLQSHEVTEYDGELSELLITFPEGYKEYVVSLERTAPTASSNTVIYPYGKKAGGGTETTEFWDSYDGEKASHYELRFSLMELDADNYIKLEGYTYVNNQPVKGKPQTMRTSGWINIGTYGNKVSSWHSVTFKTKLNVGSKYRVWGCK